MWTSTTVRFEFGDNDFTNQLSVTKPIDESKAKGVDWPSSGNKIYAHTFGCKDCPACALRFGMDPAKLAELTWNAAWEQEWPKIKAERRLSARTIKNYVSLAQSVHRFFGEMILSAIDAQTLRDYLELRKLRVKESALKHEMDCVFRPIMKRAGLWEKIAPHFVPIQVPELETKIVMTDEQESFLFEFASAHQAEEGWALAYYAASAMNNVGYTTMEMRGVQLGGLDLVHRKVKTSMAKNDMRRQPMWLNDVAVKRFAWLLERARGMNATEPYHFLIPFTVSNRGRSKPLCDPNRPASEYFIRRQFDKLKFAAAEAWRGRFAQDPGKAAEGLVFEKLTPCCFRHQFCTLVNEQPGISTQTAMRQMRLKSPKQLLRYNNARDNHHLGVVQGLATRIRKLNPNVTAKPIQRETEVMPEMARRIAKQKRWGGE